MDSKAALKDWEGGDEWPPVFSKAILGWVSQFPVWDRNNAPAKDLRETNVGQFGNKGTLNHDKLRTSTEGKTVIVDGDRQKASLNQAEEPSNSAGHQRNG